MIFPQTENRNLNSEIMDDFSLQGPLLADALEKIARINRFLGGNRVTIHGVKDLITRTVEEVPTQRMWRIADAGCGNGDMLRVLAQYAAENDLKFELTGIDANPFTIRIAEDMSQDLPSITYLCKDFLPEQNNQENYDIILLTLTLHHFDDAQIKELLTRCLKQASLGIVVNDLNRNLLAYFLFEVICLLFALNPLSRKDGLTSILRGFKKMELERFSKLLNLRAYTIHWKWAFRFQWIISTQ